MGTGEIILQVTISGWVQVNNQKLFFFSCSTAVKSQHQLLKGVVVKRKVSDDVPAVNSIAKKLVKTDESKSEENLNDCCKKKRKRGDDGGEEAGSKVS